MWIGFFLICVGILVILGNMGFIRGDIWQYIWPLFLILLGASMILKRVRRDDKMFDDENASSGTGNPVSRP
jgi:hypothetical protein